MATTKLIKQPIALLKETIATILSHPIIFFPFCIIAFIQVLLLEIIFFAPRYPLNIFFGPVIVRLLGERFLHYPFTFFMINRWFQQAQMPIYILANSFFFGAAVVIVSLINSDKKVRMKQVFNRTFSAYIHLIVAGLIAVLTLLVFSKAYGLVAQRAQQIQSTSGKFFILKQTILVGVPYFNLLFAILVSTLFAFIIPIIMIEKKKIFAAFVMNFKLLWESFWFVLTVVFLASLFYVPIFLLKTNAQIFQDKLPPESFGVMLILSIFVTLFIDAVQLTAVTTYYLLKKEVK